LLKATGASVRVLPMDLGQVFPVSGGLPLPKRAPQRQAYRLAELRRFSDALDIPLNVQPRYFPVAADDASRLIIATDLQEGTGAAMMLTGAVGAAVWAQERNIADAATLGELLAEGGLPPSLLEQSRSDEVQTHYARNTQSAIDAGVFGAPSYVIDGELFWGQDRLDFVKRCLSA
jgi:2-hydroxychromene-2-carboxylate isomerase